MSIGNANQSRWAWTAGSQFQFSTLLHWGNFLSVRVRKTLFPPSALLYSLKPGNTFLLCIPYLLFWRWWWVRANSFQLIFHGARVPAFVRCALWNCTRLQLYNKGFVTRSSSFSSILPPPSPPPPPLHFLLSYFVSKQLGLFFFFFCKSYHYSSLQAWEPLSKLQIEGQLAQLELEMRLHWGWVREGKYTSVYKHTHTYPHRDKHDIK